MASMQRRSAAILAVAVAALAPVARPQEEVAPPHEALITPETKEAVEGALRWLADQQNREGPAKGSWNARIGFKINDGYRLEPQGQGPDGLPHLGVTSLAAMAFLSGGHLPGQGPYGAVVEDALDFVMRHVNEDGFITAYGSRMYSHAFSLLFLAEVYGTTGRPDLRPLLDRAVEFTYKSQNTRGGWRYAPLARDSDMSITVCQVVALREARNIGIRVPKATIDSALRYVMESAVTGARDKGGFYYQHQEVPFNRNSFALTAAGLTTIYQAALYSDRDIGAYCDLHGITTKPRIGDCLLYLRDHYGDVRHEYGEHYFYYYGNYYAAQAMYTRGGEEWKSWYRMVRDDLLAMAKARRGEDGEGRTWWIERLVGNTYSTAVAAIILQVPNHYLPIFQR
jgi:hypothetical protein